MELQPQEIPSDVIETSFNSFVPNSAVSDNNNINLSSPCADTQQRNHTHSSRMQKAIDIVSRFDARGQVFPRYLMSKSDTSKETEYRDADKLKYWKNAYTAGNLNQCPVDLSDFLDLRMPGWRDAKDRNALSGGEQMQVARGIVQRCQERASSQREGDKRHMACGEAGDLPLPRELRVHEGIERATEYKDAQKLSKWKQALKGRKHGHACSPEVKGYLDAMLPGWDRNVNSKRGNTAEVQMDKARAVLARYQSRGQILPRHLNSRGKEVTPEQQQEHSDAQKLAYWKHALIRPNRGQCPAELKQFLDDEMPGWSSYVNSHKGLTSDHQMQMARDVASRFQSRGQVFPRQWKDRAHPEKMLEYKDAIRLSNWKRAANQEPSDGGGSCNEIVAYLDTAMPVDDILWCDVVSPGWREGPREYKSYSRKRSKPLNSDNSVSSTLPTGDSHTSNSATSDVNKTIAALDTSSSNVSSNAQSTCINSSGPGSQVLAGDSGGCSVGLKRRREANQDSQQACGLPSQCHMLCPPAEVAEM